MKAEAKSKRIGRPINQRIRWGIERAAQEFGLNPRTLKTRLVAASIDPEPDGYWSTKQIVRAIYSDLESERIRKTRAEADQVELQNAEATRRLVDVDEFSRQWEPRAIAMVRVIKSSKLSEQEQHEILSELSQIAK